MESRYYELYNKAPVGYITVSPTGALLEANDTAKAMFVKNPEDLLGQNIKSFILKSDLEKYEKVMRRMPVVNKVQTVELRMAKSNKRTVWIQMTLVKERASDHPGAYRIILIDITERRHIGKAMIMKKDLLETTLTSAGDGVISTDKRGNVVFMNTAAEHLTGWTQEMAVNQPISLIFNVIYEKTRKNKSNIVKLVFDSEKTKKFTTPTLLITKEGKERSIEASVAPIILQNSETVGVVVMMQDCTDKKRKLDETLYHSHHDHLTGLYNRRYYEEQLIKLDQKKYLPLTLIMGDVNGLKLVNDSFGHVAGDELLKMVSSVIHDSCRREDIVARLGGDEFIIILPNADESDAERILKRIKSLSLDKSVESVAVSVSLGYEIKRVETEKIDDIYKKAEEHMYRNKQQESLGFRSEMVQVILKALFQKSSYEKNHSIRAGNLCKRVAQMLQFNVEEVKLMKMAGELHDIGKIGISEDLLNTSRKVNEDEWTEIKKHPELGYRILASTTEHGAIAQFILEHHERFDGLGYPSGLKGQEISIQARILAVVGAFDTMTHTTIYGAAVATSEAVLEINKGSGTLYDPVIVNAFCACLEQGNTSRTIVGFKRRAIRHVYNTKLEIVR